MLPLVVHIEGNREAQSRTRAFHESPVRIGRSPFASLRLRDPFVSEWQAVVRFHAERTTYLDLGGKNPTRIDGRAIERNVEVAIDEQSVVCIGTLRLRFARLADAPQQRDPASDQETAFVPHLSLEPECQSGTLLLPAAGLLPPPEHPQAPTLRAAALPGRTPQGTAPRSAPPPAPARTPRRAQTTASDATEARLLAAHRDYRRAFAEFMSLVHGQIESSSASTRAACVIALRRRFPELIHETAFRDWAQSAGVNTLQLGHLDVEEWLGRLCGRPTSLSVEQAALSMERVGHLLEIFASAFIEARRAHHRARRKLALDHAGTDQTNPSPLAQSEDPHAVLAYLLSHDADVQRRNRELRRTLGDFAMHQIALLSAVVEGARALLDQLGPEALGASNQLLHTTSIERTDRWTKLWPYSARKLWIRFVVRHSDLTQTDHFTRALFGREFTRRYHAIADSSAAVRSSPSHGAEPAGEP